MYLAWKYLHVLFAIAVFGHIFASVYSLYWAGRRDGAALRVVLEMEGTIGRVMGPVSLTVLATGLYLGWKYYALRQTWIWTSVVLFAAVAAIGHAWVGPAADRALARLRADGAADPVPLVFPVRAGLLTMSLLTAVIAALMVYRPS
jgi:hypothetical protein